MAVLSLVYANRAEEMDKILLRRPNNETKSPWKPSRILPSCHENLCDDGLEELLSELGPPGARVVELDT